MNDILDSLFSSHWHGFWEPIVVAVVTGGIGFCFYVAKRIFRTFVALAIAREDAQDKRLDSLEAWRTRTLLRAAEKVDGEANGEDDARSGRGPGRLRHRNED